MNNKNPLHQRIKDIVSTGECRWEDFETLSCSKIEDYEFDFGLDVSKNASEMLENAFKQLNFNEKQLERLERIVRGIVQSEGLTNTDTEMVMAHHMAEAIQYVTK